MLGGFLALSAAVASTGILFKPGRWYEGLTKPGWTPPKRAFPIVWGVLYVMIAVSGWLVWRKVGFTPAVFVPFGAQLVFNFLWSALFFGLRKPIAALVDILLLWVAIGWTVLAFRSVDPLAATLLVPYWAWVSVAAALNFSVWNLNRGRGVFA